MWGDRFSDVGKGLVLLVVMILLVCTIIFMFVGGCGGVPFYEP